jgi:hypothetical protein
VGEDHRNRPQIHNLLPACKSDIHNRVSRVPRPPALDDTDTILVIDPETANTISQRQPPRLSIRAGCRHPLRLTDRHRRRVTPGHWEPTASRLGCRVGNPWNARICYTLNAAHGHRLYESADSLTGCRLLFTWTGFSVHEIRVSGFRVRFLGKNLPEYKKGL